MPIAKCPRCEKMYNKAPHMSSGVCPACLTDEETDFDIVRDALNDHPDLNSEQITEVCGVAVDCVLRMLDAGALSNIDFNHKFKCGRCGAPAIGATKRLCQACLDKLDKEVAKTRNSIELKKKKATQIGEYTVNVRKMIEAKRK